MFCQTHDNGIHMILLDHLAQLVIRPDNAWLDELFDDVKYVDAFREVNPEPDQYTWWSNRGQAWAKNVGWRLDYQVATPGLADAARAAAVYKEQRFSDHAPLTVDYDWAL